MFWQVVQCFIFEIKSENFAIRKERKEKNWLKILFVVFIVFYKEIECGNEGKYEY
jgi:hypothetical protein